MADWAGKTLGKIHIQGLLARGGIAEVYLGIHEVHGEVAVKILRGLLEREFDHLARFKREAEVVASLKHPNIVQMLDYTVVDETPCLAMEYIAGPSLATYLKSLQDRKHQLPIGIVANLITALASALDYAHDKGIVHRDIKPANVLLRSSSHGIKNEKTLPLDVQPVLTDFGLVRLLDLTMHTTAGSVAGTPAYMSPEQARGEKVDKRTDIYSLGIMLYEMLSGSVPFQSDTTFGMLMKHINEPPPVIKGISPDLQALIDRALAKDPALRYGSAGELANEFIAIFNGQTVSPGTLHLAQMAREPAVGGQAAQARPEDQRRGRWRIAVEAAIAIGLVLILLLQIFRPSAGTATATPDPNVPVGRMRFDDFAFFMDRVSVSLNNVPLPESGMHYEAWLVSNDASQIRAMGPITFSGSGLGRLEYNDPDEINLLRDFNQVQITREQDNVAIAEPTGEVLYSSVFPPEVLVPVRNVVVSHPDLPDQGPLLQNLWYYSADYVKTSINGSEIDENYLGMVKALEAGDEATLRKRVEEVINMLVGDASDLYRDYDENGAIDDPGDGYGSLPNGDRLGYLQETMQNTKSATEAADTTANIRTYGENIQVCVANLETWSTRMLELARQVQQMPLGPEMLPLVSELSSLGANLVDGMDADGDNIVEPTLGECGATLAYEYGWYLADMPLYIGPDRIPPPAK